MIGRGWKYRMLATSLVVAALLSACEAGVTVSQADGTSSEASEVAEEANEISSPLSAADLGRGFIVWESNRNGAWRIWTRNLDGSGLRRLTPNRSGEQHCCAHISPDGGRVAYLALKGPLRRYPAGTDTGSLRLIEVDGSGDRELAASVRTYHEHRVGVWRSDSELIHLAGDGRTVLLDVDSGSSEILLETPAEEYGWLIDRTLRHATLGLPSFSPYDREKLQVTPQQRMAGCQAYFTADGRWGYWMAGAGGPIHRLDLAGRETSTLLRKNDPLLPPEFGYLYFPMTSDDGRLLAVGASDGTHDHFKADYEIFVLETDPRSLEVRGPAVRLTFDPAVDRFPDVFTEPLALGDHSGEAPFEVELDAGREGEWLWDLAGERRRAGRVVSHSFRAPGVFRVTAASGDEVLAGLVRVAAAAAPEVAGSELRDGGRQVIVRFDEAVATDELEIGFDSGRSVERWTLEADATVMRLEVEPPVERPDRLTLRGLSDRAQSPNVAPSLSVALEPPLWPSSESDLAFLWQTADAANFVFDRARGSRRAPTLQTQGRATFDHAFAMLFAGGSIVADGETAAAVVAEAKGTNELSIELTLRPHGSGGGSLMRLERGRRRLLSLELRGGSLRFALLTGRDPSPPVELFPLAGEAPVHVVVTYRPGQLRAYRDGELIVDRSDRQGDFFHWQPGELRFGDGWPGGVEGVAVYSRVLEADEVGENAERYRAVLGERPSVPRGVVQAVRSRSAMPPTLESISPYREALVVAEFRVEAVEAGKVEGGTIRVAEWAVLGGEELERPAGTVRLVLERFADNPQLEGVVLGQDLEGGVEAELYYALP